MIPEYLLEAKNNNEIQWLSVSNVETEKNKAHRAITHWISTADLDRHRDVMKPEGMVDKDFDKSPSVWYNHSYRVNDLALPIAGSGWRRKKEEGVLAFTKFAKHDFADDVYNLHLDGFMNTWSIGFRPVKDKSGIVEKDSIVFDEKKNITTWHKWELLEYSSAPIAANPNARDMVKDLMNMDWKSESTINLLRSEMIEVEVKNQLEEMKSEIAEIKTLKDLLFSLSSKSENNDKQIQELINQVKKIEQTITKNISIELPVVKFDDNRIKTIVKKVLDGGR